MCFSVVSHPAEAQVPIFTAQMKKASKKSQKKKHFLDVCFFHVSYKNRYLRFRRMQNDRKTL